MPETGREPLISRARIDGIDAARGFALIGMFIAHVAPAVASADLSALIAVADERPRILFALTAGLGLGLITGGTRATPPGERSRVRQQIALRGLLLIALGLIVAVAFHPLVYIILDVYGVAFLLLLPLLYVRPAIALTIGALGVVIAPGAAVLLGQTDAIGTARENAQIPVDWFVTGAYPVVTWVAVMLIGLGITRLGVLNRRVQAVAAAAGTLAAAVMLPIAASVMPDPAAIVATGVQPEPWQLPLAISLETIGNVGVALAVVAALVALTTYTAPRAARIARAALAPITAMGSMPLTIYTVHLVIISFATYENESGVLSDDSWVLLVSLIVGSMIFALLWRHFIGRGPLEEVLRIVTRRPRTPESANAAAAAAAAAVADAAVHPQFTDEGEAHRTVQEDRQ